jgi:hypothetical protein
MKELIKLFKIFLNLIKKTIMYLNPFILSQKQSQNLHEITFSQDFRNYPTKNKNYKKGKKFLSQKKRSNNRK